VRMVQEEKFLLPVLSFITVALTTVP